MAYVYFFLNDVDVEIITFKLNSVVGLDLYIRLGIQTNFFVGIINYYSFIHQFGICLRVLLHSWNFDTFGPKLSFMECSGYGHQYYHLLSPIPLIWVGLYRQLFNGAHAWASWVTTLLGPLWQKKIWCSSFDVRKVTKREERE